MEINAEYTLYIQQTISVKFRELKTEQLRRATFIVQGTDHDY
jgi:hypothetical protein